MMYGRNFAAMVWSAMIAVAIGSFGCAASNSDTPDSSATTGSDTGGGGSGGKGTGGSGGSGGAGGMASACKTDCSAVHPMNACLVSVCNEGNYLGEIGQCVVVPGPAGTACDDGVFCTVNDKCDDSGVCQGGTPNTCGITPPDCQTITCDENAKTCGTAAAVDGGECTPTADLCMATGICTGGSCIGTPKDCTFDPDNECNTVACNPATGACEATPNPGQDGESCVLSGDPCQSAKTCSNGVCGGGNPKDCSSLTVGCNEGVCNPSSGNCVVMPIGTGMTCSDGIDQCHSGLCDSSGSCVATALPDNPACDDHTACTSNDVCTAGACNGAAVSGCTTYVTEGFETCPAGFTYTGDWKCGKPTNAAGPGAAHTGVNVIAAGLTSTYSDDDEFETDMALSGPIVLTSAFSPVLSFWTWLDTEHSGSTIYDAFTVEVTTDGGSTFTLVPVENVTPAYDVTIDDFNSGTNVPSWGGSRKSWQNYIVDLSSFAGQTIQVAFAFHSDSSNIGTFAGVFIDDFTIAEGNTIAMTIPATTLGAAVVGSAYAAPLKHTGGDSAAVWSITSGGTNDGWLTINPVTGALTGTPAAANAGPVTVHVHVEEPSVPSNFADATFTFNVFALGYTEGFESCATNGWTLTGNWQCGPVIPPGPSAAFAGTNDLSIRDDDDNVDTPAMNQATSPVIDLTAATSAQLSFEIYLDVNNFDSGVELQASKDGAAFAAVTTTMPAFNIHVGSGGTASNAWTGENGSLGYQVYTADLTSFAGHTVKLRFSFASDFDANPGAFIDNLVVGGN